MPSKTRAALRAEAMRNDKISTADAEDTLQSSTTQSTRIPLGDVVPNGAEKSIAEPATTDSREKTATAKRGKAGKKTKSSRRGEKTTKDDAESPESKSAPEPQEKFAVCSVSDGEGVVATSLTLESTAEGLDGIHGANAVEQLTTYDEHPPSTSPTMLIATRSRLADADGAVVGSHNEECARQSACGYPVQDLAQDRAPKPRDMRDAHVNNNTAEEDALIEQTIHSTPPTPILYPTSEATAKPPIPIRSGKDGSQEDPSTSDTNSSLPENTGVQPEDPIEALDALEDAVEEGGKALPTLKTPASPEKRRKSKTTISGNSSHASLAAKNPSTISLGVKKAAPAAKPRTTSTGSVTASKHIPLLINNGAFGRSIKSRVSSMKSSTDLPNIPEKANTAVDYLASRRPPISLSFPAPPPPPKSRKPPTRPTFQLPGDVVAAKLRAAREERSKREEKGTQKSHETKVRSVRKSSGPVIIRQTAASRARESPMHGSKIAEERKEGIGNAPAKPLGKPISLNEKSRSSTITKRASVVPRDTAVTPTLVKEHGGEKKKVHAARSSTSHAPHSSACAECTSSSQSSTTHSSKAGPPVTSSANLDPSKRSTVTAADIAIQRMKARSVFNRDKAEKEERERLRREKEEAAKNARAQAAERGRQASREWAERQKQRQLELRLVHRIESGV